MCRNIRILFNFDPPATEEEMRAAALQYVRKVSGTNKPAKINQDRFERAVDDVTRATRELLEHMERRGPARNREDEAAKAKARSAKRFGTSVRAARRPVDGP
jgi:hypothetical protein